MKETIEADLRSPEGVATSVFSVEGWEGVQLEDSVVGGDGLEGDVGVPVGATRTLQISRMVKDVGSVRNLRRQLRPVSARCSILTASHRRNDADLVTELRGFLGNRVNMQLRRLRLAGQLSKLCSELFLFGDGEVLVAEEDNATLGN